MTGEQSVLVFGILCVVLFVVLLSRGPRKKTSERSRSATNTPATQGIKAHSGARARRRKR
jgi:hypothetical protein